MITFKFNFSFKKKKKYSHMLPSEESLVAVMFSFLSMMVVTSKIGKGTNPNQKVFLRLADAIS